MTGSSDAASPLIARQAWVLRGLLDAVIAAPQINFPEALLALAKTLAGQA